MEDNPEQSEPQVAQSCQCGGECTCGTKYKTIRPTYYEVDVNEYINSLNDWD